jgi:hypothetical protein
MSEQESAKAAVETALSNPKVSGIVAALTSSSGAAALFSSLNSVLGAISLALGCVVAVYTIRILHTKSKIYDRMHREGESLKE